MPKSTKSPSNLLQKIFYDKNNKLVIAQWPNKWAWIAIVGWLLGRTFEDSGLLEWLGWSIFLAGVFPWSYLEIKSGANYWRKALGLLVLIWAAKVVIARLGA